MGGTQALAARWLAVAVDLAGRRGEREGEGGESGERKSEQ
jgi:hypothetical protein